MFDRLLLLLSSRLHHCCLIVCVVTCTTSCGSGGGGQSACSTPDNNGPAATGFSAVEVIVSGAPGANGIFDPAPLLDETGSLWMSYSTVNPSLTVPLQTTRSHLAQWDPMTTTWSDIGVDLNQDPEQEFDVPDGQGGTTKAIWQYEVSRPVYDPFATNANERWKILWHRHLTALLGGIPFRLVEHGWIGLITAASPNGPWSMETNFLAGGLYDTVNDGVVGVPRFNVKTNLNALSSCQVFTEPGMLATADGIYISLKCFTPTSGKVVLLNCNHAMTNCGYQGDLLDDTQANRFSADGQNLDGFSATDLVQINNTNYLFVTPTANDAYNGCLAFIVEDLQTAQLRNDSCGRPQAILRINGDMGLFNGACGYANLPTAGGILFSQHDTSSIPNFRIFQTDVFLP